MPWIPLTIFDAPAAVFDNIGVSPKELMQKISRFPCGAEFVKRFKTDGMGAHRFHVRDLRFLERTLVALEACRRH